MATKTWIGNAADVQQITTITVGGTWLSTETATLTINGKDLTITLVGDEATTVVATALKEAWMSGVRLDGTGTTDATSNVGGQQFGEFAEVTASVSGSVVTLKGNTPGVPFVVSASETSTSGTLTPATPQACTGKEYWDNADNWDTGTVPASDDTVVFRDSNVSCRYGLPNGTLEVTIQQYQSFTGEIGLPPINNNNVAKPYYEYRQRYVRLDDAGGGSDIAHRFGIGLNGTGSPLINLKHSTVKISPVVFNTGTPLNSRPGTKALNICGATNTSTLNILNGSVDWGTQDGTASLFATVTQAGGDSKGINGLHATASTVTCHGGTLLVGGSTSGVGITTRGGTVRAENQTGTIATMLIYGGTVDYASTATISLFKVTSGGTFDARSDAGGFTITAGSLFDNCRFLDPYGRATASSNFYLYREPSADLQFGGSAANGVQVVL